MGKSKAARIQKIDDGGFVPRQSSLAIQMHEKAQMRRAREAKLTEGRAINAERLKAHEEELRRKQEEFDKPLPDFPPRIPQEVRAKFFQYVAHVVSDTLWNLENPEGDEQDAHEKLPRKKVPAECLKAALRISTLGIGGLATRLYIFVDISRSCFNESDKIWLGAYSYSAGFPFDNRIEYRIKCNLWKNVPYFVSFDPERQNVDRATQVIEWDVHRERDFEILKKSGFLYPDEKRVIHLEIF